MSPTELLALAGLAIAAEAALALGLGWLIHRRRQQTKMRPPWASTGGSSPSGHGQDREGQAPVAQPAGLAAPYGVAPVDELGLRRRRREGGDAA